MNKLKRMKMLATGLLVLAGAVYAAASALEPGRPWLHYVAAAAEAAMIGAIADWFAVVALFHHPFNLRFIPHTAIIPRNKARIAEGLRSSSSKLPGLGGGGGAHRRFAPRTRCAGGCSSARTPRRSGPT